MWGHYFCWLPPHHLGITTVDFEATVAPVDTMNHPPIYIYPDYTIDRLEDMILDIL